MMRCIKPRNKNGSLAEAAVAMALYFSILILLGLAIVEATNGYQIMRDLQIGAGLAARALATSGSTTTSTQQSTILGNIKVGSYVVDASQFYSVVWNKTSSPSTVTVYIQYKSTGTQPPTFPYPDPLHLGSLFNPKSQATYRLQS